MKARLKDFLLMIIASILVGLIFVGYMIIIGIPKTQARNLYNKYLEEIAKGNERQAMEYLQEAKNFWTEVYMSELTTR